MDDAEALVAIIAGLPALDGPAPGLRLSYAGTWDPPVHITATFSEPDASLVVVHPGPDVVEILREVMRRGTEPYPSPSRREERGPLEEPHLRRLMCHATTTAWTLTGRELGGNDGHWLTVEVHHPDTGRHRASSWCPPPADPLVVVARDMIDAACTVDPELAESPWVRDLRAR